MAIDIKVIPTLRGDEAVRFVEKAEEVMNSNNRVDFCPMRAGISLVTCRFLVISLVVSRKKRIFAAELNV